MLYFLIVSVHFARVIGPFSSQEACEAIREFALKSSGQVTGIRWHVSPYWRVE